MNNKGARLSLVVVHSYQDQSLGLESNLLWLIFAPFSLSFPLFSIFIV